MSMAEIEKQRLARRKGDILRILLEEYRSAREMTSIGNLIGTLDAIGEPVSPESIQFDLHYLSDQGYIRVWLNRDVPGFRKDRQNAGLPTEIRFCRLVPRGIQLIDGNITEDPQVKF